MKLFGLTITRTKKIQDTQKALEACKKERDKWRNKCTTLAIFPDSQEANTIRTYINFDHQMDKALMHGIMTKITQEIKPWS